MKDHYRAHILSGLATTSWITYGLLLLLEWIRPGFVSYVFSPHLFLFISIILTTVFVGLHKPKCNHDHNLDTPKKILIGLFAIIFCLFAWVESKGMGDLRFLISLGALLTPIMIGSMLVKK